MSKNGHCVATKGINRPSSAIPLGVNPDWRGRLVGDGEEEVVKAFLDLLASVEEAFDLCLMQNLLTTFFTMWPFSRTV